MAGNGADSRSKLTIWDTLKEAKQRQEKIRNRVRTYGVGEEDSDYDDSPFSENDMKNRTATEISSDNSGSDHDGFDEDYGKKVPLNSTKTQPQNRKLTQYSSSPSPGSMSVTKRRSSSDIRNLRRSLSSKGGNDYQMQQMQANLNHPTLRSSNSRKGKLPALTPEEAIRLVMERHTYISDSEQTDDDHPIQTRKGSVSKHSNSTNETAMNTVSSHSGHNRTPEGRRVLVLRKKKYREDTHPRTSKNKNYQMNQREKHQRQPLLQQRNVVNHQQDSIGRVLVPSKSAQTTFEEKPIRTTRSKEPRKSDASQSLKSSMPPYQQDGVEGNKTRSHKKREHENADILKQFDEIQYLHENNSVSTFDDDHADNVPSIGQHFQPRNQVVKARDYRETTNKRSDLRALLVVPNNVGMTEKEIGFHDNGYCTDSDTDQYEDLGQRSSDSSGISDGSDTAVDRGKNVGKYGDQSNKDSGEDSQGFDEEEDWRGVSWKTAKTSRSVVSKFSKSSSTSVWMKTMEEGDGSSNENSDIVFFDAIQEMTDASPTEIDKDESMLDQDDASGPRTEVGWTGTISNFVGYTIGALSGGKDVDEANNSDNDGVGNTSVASPRTAASKSPSSSIKRKSPTNNSQKAVPSRELEIIRKCQEMMKSQRLKVETRKREADRHNLEDIRLRRKEEAARARVWREVMAYREMMEGMGKGDKLAPLDSKDAAQNYDDRLAMVKTLEDQEKKMKMHARSMMQMEMDHKESAKEKSRKGCKECFCSCVIS